MRTTILYLVLITMPALAQSAPAQTAPQPTPPASHPRKVLTPDQIAYQAALKTYQAQTDKLRAAATAAYNAELAREKSPACPKAMTTVDINECLFHEDEVTERNYQAFTKAVRAILALPTPQMPGDETPYVGPTGPGATPATDTAAFDAAESAWQSYAKAQCTAVDVHWRGGTIVNSMVGYCELRVTRHRMDELASDYMGILE